MHSPTLLFLVTLLTTAVFATPTPFVQKRSFTHELKRNPDYVPDGALARRKAFAKYGFSDSANMFRRGLMGAGPNGQSGMPAPPMAAQPENQTGQDAAKPANMNAEFLSPVNVGGQQLMMDFDTGSSDLWVFSTQTNPSESQGHTLFSMQKSQTFQQMQGATWKISYGDDSGAAGFVGTDTVNIGGATATKQAVEVATAVTQSFMMDTMNDGLVGLAFSKLNQVQPQPQKTFFDTVMPTLDMPVFVANLQQGTGGSYTFGKIDPTQFEGPMSWAPVNSSAGFWQVDSPAFAINGKVQQNPTATPAIADTGTSLLLVDDNVAQAYYQQVAGAMNNQEAGGFVYPCSAQLPSFSVAIGSNYLATVPGNMITFANAGEGMCFGGVQSNMGAPMQIYGDTMFKTQIVAFNGGNVSLGIAPKTGQPASMQVPGVGMKEKASAGVSLRFPGAGAALIPFFVATLGGLLLSV